MEGAGGRPPRGFEKIEGDRALALARPEAEGWVRAVFREGDTLHGAASRARGALQVEGRGTVFVIPAPHPGETAGGRWAVRHYVRGGRIAPLLLKDRYSRWGRLRPFHELEASEDVRARGIPTPRVMAAAAYRGALFYRADLVTEFIPGAAGLVEALFRNGRGGVGAAMERRDALRAAGALIAHMALRGVLHRDLHAGNILLEWKGVSPVPHLLDLDRCRVAPRGRPVSPRPMIRRLTRSLRKWERRTGLLINPGGWEAFDQGLSP